MVTLVSCLTILPTKINVDVDVDVDVSKDTSDTSSLKLLYRYFYPQKKVARLQRMNQI